MLLCFPEMVALGQMWPLWGHPKPKWGFTLYIIIIMHYMSSCFLETLHNKLWCILKCPSAYTYLSASSKISTSMALRLNEGQLCRWSISLPGVAIRISGPARKAASCDFTSRPPRRDRAWLSAKTKQNKDCKIQKTPANWTLSLEGNWPVSNYLKTARTRSS